MTVLLVRLLWALLRRLGHTDRTDVQHIAVDVGGGPYCYGDGQDWPCDHIRTIGERRNKESR